MKWLLLAALFLSASTVKGKASAPVVEEGFSGDHYQALWTTSPFAVATPDSPGASTDYSLVGIAQFDGIYYANLVDKQSQEHFLVTSKMPVRGLTLVSVAQGHDASQATAILQKEGQLISLKLETPAVNPSPGMPPPGVAYQPSLQPPQPAMPTPQQPGNMSHPPVFRRPYLIRVPPPPSSGQNTVAPVSAPSHP